jgi:exosortase/archaeosortase family protein
MKSPDKYSPFRFIAIFLVLFIAFYYFNIFFFGITSKGNHYNAFLDNHLNYIRVLRHGLLRSSAFIIDLFGFTSITNDYELLVAGHGTLRVVYSCLGLGVMSFFAAFVIAYPKNIRSKLLFLIPGLISIQLLNIARFVLLAILWDKKSGLIVDHHTIFNLIIYIIIVISIYFWVKHDNNQPISNAKN